MFCALSGIDAGGEISGIMDCSPKSHHSDALWQDLPVPLRMVKLLAINCQSIPSKFPTFRRYASTNGSFFFYFGHILGNGKPLTIHVSGLPGVSPVGFQYTQHKGGLHMKVRRLFFLVKGYIA
jgi:hypothetical protein